MKSRTSGRPSKAEAGEAEGSQKLRYRTRYTEPVPSEPRSCSTVSDTVPLRAGQTNPIEARNRSPSTSPVPEAVGRILSWSDAEKRLVGAGAGPEQAGTDRTRHSGREPKRQKRGHKERDGPSPGQNARRTSRPGCVRGTGQGPGTCVTGNVLPSPTVSGERACTKQEEEGKQSRLASCHHTSSEYRLLQQQCEGERGRKQDSNNSESGNLGADTRREMGRRRMRMSAGRADLDV